MRLALPVLAFLTPLVLASPAWAQDEGFSVTPYIWLPNVDGSLNFDIPSGASSDVTVGPNDYLENLDMVLMIAGEYRGNDWSLFTDIVYLDFSNENASVREVSAPGPIQIPIDVGSQISLKGLLWTVGGGYELVDREDVSLDLFAGVRYLGAEERLNWSLAGPLNQFPQSGTVEADEDLWDGLVGVRGEGRLGNWFFPFYADVGGGTSDLTWQAMAGIGYRFGGWDVLLAYRHLAYEQGDDGVLKDIAFSGPAFGATFRF